MKIVTNSFSEEMFEKYKTVLQKFELTEYQSYIKETVHVKNWEDLKSMLRIVITSDSSNMSLSYRYVDDEYFMIALFISGTVYIVSDLDFDKKNILTTAIIKLITSKKSKKLYVWNLRHFLAPIVNRLTPQELLTVSKNFYDVRIIDHLVNQTKNPTLIKEKNEDENDKKIKVFLDKIHQNEAFYYYIPRHILQSVLIKEAVVVSMLGQTSGYVATKLNQMQLLHKLQRFSVFLCDMEVNNFMYYDREKIEEHKSNPFVQRLSEYADAHDDPIKLEYKFMNSTTGRLSFHNKTKINLMSIPKSDVREIFIPENDLFLSIDINGMEVFHCAKTYSDYLEGKEITKDFDIYEEITKDLETDKSRSVVKNAVIKLLYGSTKFTTEESEVVILLERKIPQLYRENPVSIPKYVQTNSGRIIKIDKAITKYLNNIIQSESNDVMMDVTLKIWAQLKVMNLKTKIKILSHDEIVFDVPTSEVAILKEIIEKCNDVFPYKLKTGVNLSKV